MDGRIRILVAKPGLDGHDRGAKVVSMALRDAGFEVIYTGRHQGVSSIVATAIQEDVDVVGLSILSGAYEDYCSRLAADLHQLGADNVVLAVGGTIPPAGRSGLEELGFLVFPTGSSLADIVDRISQEVARRRAAAELNLAGSDDTFST